MENSKTNTDHQQQGNFMSRLKDDMNDNLNNYLDNLFKPYEENRGITQLEEVSEDTL